MVLDPDAEPAAEQLVDDLVSKEYKEGKSKHDPAQDKQGEGGEVEQLVAVVPRLAVRVSPLHVVYRVIVTEAGSEGVESLSAQKIVKGIWTHEVPHDPPRNCDHPENQNYHHNNVIDQVTTKLTETTGDLVATVLSILDVSSEFVESNSEEEEH